MSTSKTYRKQLVSLLSGISEPKEMDSALEAIFTAKELEAVEKRLQIYKLLSDKKTQREIATTLNVGIATVTRGANAYREGKFAKLEALLRKEPKEL